MRRKPPPNDSPSSGTSEPQLSPRSPSPPEYLSQTWSNRNTIHDLVGLREWELDDGQGYHGYKADGEQV